MNPLRYLVLTAVGVGTILHGSTLAAQAPDTAAVSAAIQDYRTACHGDNGRLWGRSLCGPLILFDPATRWAAASDSPPEGSFQQNGTVFLGQAPDAVPYANTGFDWAGQRWASVILPLPTDRFARLALLLHEAFHGIQPALGLTGPDRLNAHLDERDGRYWLRLELRAYQVALQTSDDSARVATRDGLLFRARRRGLYPGADTLEAALELQEGLAEYSGDRLALDYLGLPPSRVAQALRRFESRPSYARALGYGTGPALGLLLDRYASGWRNRVRQAGVSPQLAAALKFLPPADSTRLAAAATERARVYDDGTIATAEDAREVDRQHRLADYRARLITGPVVVFRQDGLGRTFDPNTLVPFPGEGTVYPLGIFEAGWGKLTVDSLGALVSTDFRLLRIPAPQDATGSTVRGPGWTLELKDGWTLRPGPRPGDWEVRQGS